MKILSINNEELFQPSLNDEWQETKSYDISKLFYVSFFGGIIPTIVLGTKNARWLNISKKYINVLLFFGIGILLAKFVAYSYLYAINLDQEYSRELKTIYKLGSILLFGAYYKILKTNYKRHIALFGTTKPILKDSLIWIGIAIVIEFILLIGGVVIIDYFI